MPVGKCGIKRVAQRKIQRHHLTSLTLYHPLHNDSRPCILFEGLLLLKDIEVCPLIHMFVKEFPGQGSRKLHYHIEKKFVSPSIERIQVIKYSSLFPYV